MREIMSTVQDAARKEPDYTWTMVLWSPCQNLPVAKTLLNFVFNPDYETLELWKC